MDQELELAVVAGAAGGTCVFCRRSFGSRVRWWGRPVVICEEADEVYSRPLGGYVSVASCSLCNRVRAPLDLDTAAGTQDACLAALVGGGSLTPEQAQRTAALREIWSDPGGTLGDTCVRPGEPPGPEERRLAARRTGDRTRRLEREAAVSSVPITARRLNLRDEFTLEEIFRTGPDFSLDFDE